MSRLLPWPSGSRPAWLWGTAVTRAPQLPGGTALAPLFHTASPDCAASPGPEQGFTSKLARSGIYLPAGPEEGFTSQPAPRLPSGSAGPGQRGRPACSNCCYVQHGASATALPPQGCPAEAPAAPRAPAATLASPIVLRHPPAGAALPPGHGHSAARPSPQPGPPVPAQAAQARLGRGGDRGSGLRSAPAGGGQKHRARGCSSRKHHRCGFGVVIHSAEGKRALSPCRCPQAPTAALPASPALPRRCSPKQVRASGALGPRPRRARRGAKLASVCRRPSAALLCPLFLTPLSSRGSSRPLGSAVQTRGARCAGQAGELTNPA